MYHQGLPRIALLLLPLFSRTTCSPIAASDVPLAHPNQLEVRSPGVSTVTDIWDFPPGTWVENLAVRANGQILVTLLNTPEVYQVDPTLKVPATLVHKFPDYLSCSGITELGTDQFYVIAGNTSTVTITTVVGSYSVWKLNLSGFVPGGTVSAVHIADFPESIFFNGMTSLGPSSNLLLIADSRGNDVWTVNVVTGAINKAISDPLMDGLTTGEDIGINGVKVKNGVLYFTNADQALFASEPINAQGESKAPATVVTSGLSSVDDFVFGPGGQIFFAGNNELRVKPANGNTVSVVSNNTLLTGSTAVEFGRGFADQNDAYVTTNGGVAQYETQTFTVPGRVVKVAC